MAVRIESVREKASGTLEVALSGGLLFRFDAKDAELLGYLFDHGVRTLVVAEGSSPVTLMTDETLDEEAVSALGRLDALHRARKEALSILSRAEQGSRQLYGKLLNKGYEPAISHTCLKWLCDQRCVDDRRYVAMLVRSHMVRKGQGPDRIKALAWPRIGLFEDPKTILADGFASLAEDEMQEAIRRSCVALLRRTQRFPRGGRGIGRRHCRPHDLSQRPGTGADAEPHLLSFSEQYSLLRAHLKHEGFPSKAVDVFLESWEKEASDDE